MATQIASGNHVYGGACVTNSSGNIYVLFCTTYDNLEIYKSTNGGGRLSRVGNGGKSTTIHGTTNAISTIDAAVDSSGYIHVISNSCTNGLARDVAYCLFNTANDTWGTWEEAAPISKTNANRSAVSIALDSNGKPHVLYSDYVKVGGNNYSRVQYVNKTGSSWSTPLFLGASTSKGYGFPRILVRNSNIIEAEYYCITDWGVEHVTYSGGSWGTPSYYSYQGYTGPQRAQIVAGGTLYAENVSWNTGTPVYLMENNAYDTNIPMAWLEYYPMGGATVDASGNRYVIYLDSSWNRVWRKNSGSGWSSATTIGQYASTLITEYQYYFNYQPPSKRNFIYRWPTDGYWYYDFLDISVKSTKSAYLKGKSSLQPYALGFNWTTTSVNVGNDSSLDNLHAGSFTIDGWIKVPVDLPYGHEVISKGDLNVPEGWGFFTMGMSGDQPYRALWGIVGFDGSPAVTNTKIAIQLIPEKWTHITFAYNASTKTIALAVDGVWDDGTARYAGSGNYKTDAAKNLYIGAMYSGELTDYFRGEIAWLRISTGLRYTDGTPFTPLPLQTKVEVDGTTKELWQIEEGSGSSLYPSVNPANIGTITDGTWIALGLPCYLNGASAGTNVKANIPLYTKGQDTTKTNLVFYLKGQDTTKISVPCYIKGGENAATSWPTFMVGQENVLSDAPAFLQGGVEESSSLLAYIVGIEAASSAQLAFLEGDTSEEISSLPVFLQGQSNVQDNQAGFLLGQSTQVGSNSCYLAGLDTLADNIPAYSQGQGHDTSSIPSYCEGAFSSLDQQPAYLEGFATPYSSIHGYLVGQVVSEQPAYTAGDALEELVPESDIIVGDWKNELGGTTLAPSLSEYPPNDEEYVYFESPQGDEYFEVALSNPIGDPERDYIHSIEWRSGLLMGDATITMRVELRQGNSVIAQDSRVITNDFQTFEYLLTQQEINSITDYDDLRLRFVVEAVS